MRIAKRIRLLIVLGLLLVLSFTGLSLFSYRTARTSLQDEIINSSLPLLRENIYSDIQRDLLPALNIASAMAHDTFLVSWISSGESSLPAIQRYLDKIRQEYGYFSVFFVSALTGRYYHYSGLVKEISKSDPHDVWFYDFAASGKRTDLDVDTDEASGGKMTVFINNRVIDAAGRFLGVAGVGLEMKGISTSLREKQVQYHRTIYMTDDQGLVQAHSDPSVIEKQGIPDMPGIRDIAGQLLVKSAVPLNLSYNTDSAVYHVSSRYIPELDWFLVVEQEEGTSLGAARASLWITLGGGLLVSVVILFLSALSIRGFTRRLEESALTDELTGASNRRRFNDELLICHARFVRTGRPHALILFDVDHFKQINDQKGHLQGDAILKRISGLCRATIRPGDLFFRWGGDEFAILMEGGEPEVRAIIERIQSVIAPCPDWAGPEWNAMVPTVSLGAAVLETGDGPEDLIRRADRALYRAKQEGRNRACIIPAMAPE